MEPAEVLKAFGIGWGVFELYPNPTNQPAFKSAVDRLESMHEQVMSFEISAGSITCEGEVVELARGGVERLALRLFVHEVEWFRVMGRPEPTELAEFFRLLAADETEMRETGGIEAALIGKSVNSISVTQRGLLTEGPENAWEQNEEARAEESDDPRVRAEQVARMVQGGANAEKVASALIADGGHSPSSVAEAFCEAYRTIYPAQDEPGAPEEEGVIQLLGAAYRSGSKRKPPVDTFAEAFFMLPDEARAEVLTNFLVNRDEGLHRLLLDQFAGLELAELAPALDEAAFAELEAYVRDVVDTDLGTADELLPLVSSARDVSNARQSVAERIRTMIEGIGTLGGSSGGLAAQLREELEGTTDAGLYVLSTLVAVEDRSSRLGAMLEAWSERIGRLIGDGDFEEAAIQLEAARRGATTPFKLQFLDEALGEFVAAQPQLFLDGYQQEEHRQDLIDLLASFGEPSALKLMERLAVEESPAARRTLIGILAGVARVHPAPLARSFGAEQWYVVRNAVTIASKVGGEEWVELITPLAEHADHRVVVESLRALAAISPEQATSALVGCLTHDNERVVETAALLLRASSASNLEDTLVAAMLDKSMHTAARSEMAGVLFQLGTPSALEALQTMARRPFLLASHRRDARRAARSILASAA